MGESNPTEPANYTGSYTTESKQIVDTEIGMCPSDVLIIIGTLTAAIEWQDDNDEKHKHARK
jgi:hypothetical protein